MSTNPFGEITKLDSTPAFAERLSGQLGEDFVVLKELSKGTTYLAEKSSGEVCEYCGKTTDNLFAHLIDECEEVGADMVTGDVNANFQEDYDLDSAFDDE